MRKSTKTFPKIEEEAEEVGVPFGRGTKEEPRKAEGGQEQRKRWMKGSMEREAILAYLQNAELLPKDVGQRGVEGKSGPGGVGRSVGDVLEGEVCEAGQESAEPAGVGESEEEKENLRGNYLQLLQHEVRHLKEKFELNNGSYQLEDLMRLTVNSKNILDLEAIQKYTEYDRKVAESVYHDLECLRMSLERKIGLCSFLKVYGKMVDIINDEFGSSLKSSLEKTSRTDPYIIKKVSVAGDSDDVVKNAWRSIISVLGDRQEYLPDVWELAMSENIYYHL